MRQGTARCRIHVRQRVIAVAFGVMVFGACSGAREQTVAMPVAPVQAQQAPAPVQASFSVSLVPTVPLPIRVGTNLGFNVSANTAGYASLYLIDPAGQVTVLGENMVVSAALDLVYPSPADGFTLAAAQPVGYNRVILLVTRQAVRQRLFRLRHVDHTREPGAQCRGVSEGAEPAHGGAAAAVVGVGRDPGTGRGLKVSGEQCSESVGSEPTLRSRSNDE